MGTAGFISRKFLVNADLLSRSALKKIKNMFFGIEGKYFENRSGLGVLVVARWKRI